MTHARLVPRVSLDDSGLLFANFNVVVLQQISDICSLSELQVALSEAHGSIANEFDRCYTLNHTRLA